MPKKQSLEELEEAVRRAKLRSKKAARVLHHAQLEEQQNALAILQARRLA